MSNNHTESHSDNFLLCLLTLAILSAVFFVFSNGISGNDFWWHTKAGEWMLSSGSLPDIDPFSWFAQENKLKWVSHEWLSQIIIHLIHSHGGTPGVFAFSLSAACLMILLIVLRNRQGICQNLLFGTIVLASSIPLFAGFFCGRPQVFSYFLIFATIHCLYDLKKNEFSRKVFLIPVFSMFWANLHAGSSSLSYILCFIFLFSGLFNFSWGRLKAEKHTPRQNRIFLLTGLFSIVSLAINPYGLEMVLYPYVNMNDRFMQLIINEWNPPDAKIIYHVLFFFVPMLLTSISISLSEKSVKFTDFLLFLFFSYMFFRSLRFSIVFIIAGSFFLFEYPPAFQQKTPEPEKRKFLLIFAGVLLLTINLVSISRTLQTFQNGQLISVALKEEFVSLIKKQNPKRLFNDYDYGETLIYTGIKTFADARADLFSPHNLRDMLSLLKLAQTDEKQKERSLDPEKIIEKYNFDAFILRTGWSLSNYLRSRPDEFKILKETEETIYFERKQVNSRGQP